MHGKNYNPASTDFFATSSRRPILVENIWTSIKQLKKTSPKRLYLLRSLAYTLNLIHTIPCHCHKMSDSAKIFFIDAQKKFCFAQPCSYPENSNFARVLLCHCPKNSDFTQNF